MKKSSMIKFPIIGLFPSHFGENKGQQLMRIMQKVHVGKKKHRKRSEDFADAARGMWASSKEFQSRYKTWQDFMNSRDHDELFERDVVRVIWPHAGNFLIKPQNNMYEKDRTSNSFWWFGGSFTAEIPIKTKHRIRYLSSIGAKEIGFIGRSVGSLILATCKPLLNIYNEDQ
jgi:hypothetical protein